jgi:hypothetical protein
MEAVGPAHVLEPLPPVPGRSRLAGPCTVCGAAVLLPLASHRQRGGAEALPASHVSSTGATLAALVRLHARCLRALLCGVHCRVQAHCFARPLLIQALSQRNCVFCSLCFCFPRPVCGCHTCCMLHLCVMSPTQPRCLRRVHAAERTPHARS